MKKQIAFFVGDLAMKTKFVTILLVFLSMVFPISGHMGTALAVVLGSIPGTVTSAKGDPLVSIKVNLIDINTGKTVATTKTARDGSYSFDDLKAGETYKVEAKHGTDTASAVVTTSTGPSKPVDLRLLQTKGVPVVVGSSGGWPVIAYVAIGLAAIGAGVGGAAAAGAFSSSSKSRAPASPSS